MASRLLHIVTSYSVTMVTPGATENDARNACLPGCHRKKLSRYYLKIYQAPIYDMVRRTAHQNLKPHEQPGGGSRLYKHHHRLFLLVHSLSRRVTSTFVRQLRCSIRSSQHVQLHPPVPTHSGSPFSRSIFAARSRSGRVPFGRPAVCVRC